MPKRKKDAASLRKPREKTRKNYLPTDIEPVPLNDLPDGAEAVDSADTRIE